MTVVSWYVQEAGDLVALAQTRYLQTGVLLVSTLAIYLIETFAQSPTNQQRYSR